MADSDSQAEHSDNNEYTEHGCLQDIRNMTGNTASAESLRVKQSFKDYFSSDQGAVPWQCAYVPSGCAPQL